MDFVRYAERAADLVNAAIADEADLRAYLAYRPWLAERIVARDVPAVRRLQRNLRGLFGVEPETLVPTLNDLLRQHPVSPFISGHDEQSLHMHVAEKASSVAETLAAESLMGMAVVVCDHGTKRFGVCDGEWCDRVFVDTSPNRSRRYCSDRCSSRANVAAFRARSKAKSGPGRSTRQATKQKARKGTR